MPTRKELEAAVAFAEREHELAFETWRRSVWPERVALQDAAMRLLHARLDLAEHDD